MTEHDVSPVDSLPTGDWGVCCPRWRGIRSDHVRLGATDVHLLRAADDAPGTPQLLVHGLGGGATNWLDVIPGLAARGPVAAVDLPGFGRTVPPTGRATRLGANTRFLRALLGALGWERVVVHGNSMGGTLAILLAGMAGPAVERLVLVAPALPSPRRALRRVDPMTLRRFGPFVVPVLGGAMLRRMQRSMGLEELWEANAAYVHADASRLSTELEAVSRENLLAAQELPWRMPSLVGAAASTVSAVLGGRGLRRAVDRAAIPALVVWGDRDRLVGRSVIDALVRRRPDWELAVLEDVGHAPMMEVPERYLETVAGWLATRRHPPGERP